MIQCSKIKATFQVFSQYVFDYEKIFRGVFPVMLHGEILTANEHNTEPSLQNSARSVCVKPIY